MEKCILFKTNHFASRGKYLESFKAEYGNKYDLDNIAKHYLSESIHMFHAKSI